MGLTIFDRSIGMIRGSRVGLASWCISAECCATRFSDVHRASCNQRPSAVWSATVCLRHKHDILVACSPRVTYSAQPECMHGSVAGSIATFGLFSQVARTVVAFVLATCSTLLSKTRLMALTLLSFNIPSTTTRKELRSHPVQVENTNREVREKQVAGG